MKCAPCHRTIRPGQEAEKRVEYWRQPDGTLKLFGLGMPGGKLADATGVLESAAHSKCFHIARRRVERGGDAVLGTHPGLVDRYARE